MGHAIEWDTDRSDIAHDDNIGNGVDFALTQDEYTIHHLDAAFPPDMIILVHARECSLAIPGSIDLQQLYIYYFLLRNCEPSLISATSCSDHYSMHSAEATMFAGFIILLTCFSGSEKLFEIV
jgi:hypothetical protein